MSRLVAQETAKYLEFFSELMGKPIPKRRELTKKLRAEAIRQTGKIYDDTQRTFSPEFSQLSAADQVGRIRAFVGRRLRPAGRIPKGVDALTWWKEELDLMLGPDNAKTWRDPLLVQYLAAVGWLVNQLFERGRMGVAQAVLEKWRETQAAFTFAQAYFQRVPSAFQYLDRIWRKRLEKHHIKKLIDFYFALSGIYEVLARLLVVFNGVLNGETPEYARLTKVPLAEILRRIRRVPELQILTTAFNIDIRNSFAHSTYKILFSKKRIVMESGLDLSWNQLRKEVRNLSRVILAVSLAPFHYFRATIVILDRALDASKVGELNGYLHLAQYRGSISLAQESPESPPASPSTSLRV